MKYLGAKANALDPATQAQAFQTGDTLISSRALAAPDWLPTDGSIYQIDDYPALAAKVGSLEGRFDPIVKVGQPNTLPTSTSSCCAWSSVGNGYVAIGYDAAPFLRLYVRTAPGGADFNNATFNTAPSGPVDDAAFSPDGTYLAVATGITPFLQIYKRSGDTFTLLTTNAPDVIPAGAGSAVVWHPDGNTLFVGHANSPFISFYLRSGDTFIKQANPAALPAGQVNSLALNLTAGIGSLGNLLCAHTTTPFVTMYEVSASSPYTLTKIATNPTVIPNSTANGAAWSADGLHAAIACAGTTNLIIYKRYATNLPLTKLADVDVPPPPNGVCVYFTPDNFLIVGHNNLPYVSIYRRVGDKYLKCLDPPTNSLPPGTVRGIGFIEGTEYFFLVHNNSPYATLYRTTLHSFTTQFKTPNVTVNAGGNSSLKRYIKT